MYDPGGSYRLQQPSPSEVNCCPVTDSGRHSAFLSKWKMSFFRQPLRTSSLLIVFLFLTSAWGVESRTAFDDAVVAEIMSKFRKASDWQFVYEIERLGTVADGVIQQVVDGDGDIVGLGQPIQIGDIISDASLPRFQFIYAASSDDVEIVLLYRQAYIADILLSVYIVDKVTGAYCTYSTEVLVVPTVVALQRKFSSRHKDAECRSGYRVVIPGAGGKP